MDDSSLFFFRFWLYGCQFFFKQARLHSCDSNCVQFRANCATQICEKKPAYFAHVSEICIYAHISDFMCVLTNCIWLAGFIYPVSMPIHFTCLDVTSTLDLLNKPGYCHLLHWYFCPCLFDSFFSHR